MSKIDTWYEQVPVIRTEHLILRPFDKTDLKALRGLYSEEASYRYLGRNKNLVEMNPSYLFDSDKYDAKKQKILRWGIAECECPDIIGELMLYDIQADQYCKMGCRISMDKQKKGVATEATKGTLKYFWENEVFPTVQADVMRGNEASFHALVRSGFVFEGLKKNGRYYIYMARKNRETE